MIANMKKIVILGATSRIAVEVERILACQGCELLLIGRSLQRLAELKADLLIRGVKDISTYAADLASIQQHAAAFDFVRRTLGDYDTVLLAYGSMRDQREAEASVDALLDELQVNFVSATAIVTLFAADLEHRRTGCIAAITSVAGDRGRRSNYVYGSAKGALSLFLQGLRSRLHPAGVRVITIKPGPVQTSMTDRMPNSTRFADPEQVARDIVRTLEQRSPDVLYTPRIWRYIMSGVRQIPETIFKRLSF
ncbi:MAG TPA: SDR family oxidoreductase [Terriglobales bacterium]|jgi:decaprenylphospho-beta-D-erythro-pentofuranosid-2-ulose 2-reductase|nr:SDR family oxidoreductase [Terriglobales bacterium]